MKKIHKQNLSSYENELDNQYVKAFLEEVFEQKTEDNCPSDEDYSWDEHDSFPQEESFWELLSTKKY